MLNFAGGKPRVLIVDDTQQHLDLYARGIAHIFGVLAATSGAEALQLAAREQPDVIVLDVLMPGMDGWELCQRLRTSAATARTPIIILTGLDMPDTAERAARAGATAVLLKPCTPNELARKIAAVLQPS
jgi:two-component system cell cycle response regulator